MGKVSVNQQYLVKDYMVRPAMSLPLQANLLEAALTLRQTGFRHLPIVDGERLVGIVSDRDVSRFAPSLLSKITPEEYNEIFEKTPIERVMTREPLTVTPETPLCEAAALLYSKKLGCLPVVESDRLVGIITVIDMLRLLHHLLGGEDTTSLSVDQT